MMESAPANKKSMKLFMYSNKIGIKFYKKSLYYKNKKIFSFDKKLMKKNFKNLLLKFIAFVILFAVALSIISAAFVTIITQ